MKKKEIEKKNKYCIFCGHQNELEAKKCKSCKKTFIDEYYEFKYMAFDYVTGDLKGRAFDKFHSVLSIILNKLLYGVVVLFSVVAATNGISELLNNRMVSVEGTELMPVQFLSNNQIDNDERVINELYKMSTSMEYVSKAEEYNYHGVFNNKNIKLSEMNNKAKLALAFNYYYSNERTMMSPFSTRANTCEDVSGFPEVYNSCLESAKETNGRILSMIVYKNFSIDKFVDYYEKIFKNRNVVFESFTASDDANCEYSNENGYLCYFNRYGVEKRGRGIFYYGDGRTYDDRIEIDVAYLLCDYEEWDETEVCYSDNKEKLKLASTISASGGYVPLYYFGKNKGVKYTLTYLKNNDGSYTWYDVRSDGGYYEVD